MERGCAGGELHVERFEFPLVKAVALHQAVHAPHVVRVQLIVPPQEEGERLPQRARLLRILRQRDEVALGLRPVTAATVKIRTTIQG